MITDFLHRTLDWAAALPPNDRQVARTLQVPMSFKAAMHEGDRRQSLIDLFGIAPYANEGRGAVAFGVEKREKARFIRMVKRSEEHTSELQSLMRISYAVFCLKKKIKHKTSKRKENNSSK